MSDTIKEAEQLFRPTKPAPAAYEQEQARIRANMERLRALRLAREKARDAPLTSSM